MTVTIFGVLVLVVSAVLLLTRKPLALLVFVQYLGLMGGSAAIILSSLGGSSIPPATLALGFLFISVCLPRQDRTQSLPEAARKHVLLIIYCIYGFVAALILPRIFAGTMDVTPLRVNNLGYLFRSFPLQFTNQNITTGVYMLGTMLAAVAGHAAVQTEGAAKSLVTAAIGIAIIHIALGLASMVFQGTPLWSFVQFFRNGSYAQLTQGIHGFPRISGIMPEPSVYASFAFSSFVFLTELWIRNIRPKLTGGMALALLAVTLLALSSKAIIALTIYLLVLALRSLFLSRAIRSPNLVAAAVISWFAITAGLGLVLIVPEFAHRLGSVFALLTIEKGDSVSGMQRLYFAEQGFKAFWVSFGLGIGPGSFRSSSLFTAILGSTGVAGVCLFSAYAWQIIQPLRASTYAVEVPPSRAVGVAASWSVFMGLVGAGLTAPTADPGLAFGILAGIALGLRSGYAVRAPTRLPHTTILSASR